MTWPNLCEGDETVRGCASCRRFCENHDKTPADASHDWVRPYIVGETCYSRIPEPGGVKRES